MHRNRFERWYITGVLGQVCIADGMRGIDGECGSHLPPRSARATVADAVAEEGDQLPQRGEASEVAERAQADTPGGVVLPGRVCDDPDAAGAVEGGTDTGETARVAMCDGDEVDLRMPLAGRFHLAEGQFGKRTADVAEEGDDCGALRGKIVGAWGRFTYAWERMDRLALRWEKRLRGQRYVPQEKDQLPELFHGSPSFSIESCMTSRYNRSEVMTIMRTPSKQTVMHSYPGLVALITAEWEGTRNLMAAGWHSYISYEPPMYGVAIAPERFTHHLIVGAGAFAVNFVPAAWAHYIQEAGQRTGAEGDKFAALGIEWDAGAATGAPILRTAYVAYECRVADRQTYGDHDWFVGDMVAFWKDEALFLENGLPDFTKLELPLYLGRSQYLIAKETTVKVDLKK